MFGFNIIVGIVVLGILVFIHELGHFLVAKWIGVKVLKFSLGFGRKLAGRKWGETEYQIALVPLGGYVKLLGESPDEKVPESEKNRSFPEQSVLKRGAIVLTGPLMNLILALLLWPVVFIIGVQQPSYFASQPVVGWVEPGSPADREGFLPGDRIVSIDGVPARNWEDLISEITTSPKESLTIEFERDGKLLSKRVLSQSDPSTGAGHVGFEPDIPKMVIANVLEGKPAQKAGVQPGDIIVSINGKPHEDYLDMLKLFREGSGRELICEVQRGKETLSLAITPVFNPEKNQGEAGISFMPGFVSMELVEKHYGFFSAIQKGSQEVTKWTRLTFSILWKLVKGKFSVRHLGGPITIVRFAGQAAQSGISPLFQFVAILSLQLAILNILPLPVLDGGHLFFLLIETIIGRPVSPRKQEMAFKIGFVVLVALILVVSYNDLARIFSAR